MLQPKTSQVEDVERILSIDFNYLEAYFSEEVINQLKTRHPDWIFKLIKYIKYDLQIWSIKKPGANLAIERVYGLKNIAKIK